MTETQKADLHVHTYYSDGTFSPEEVVKYAKKIGLTAVAICDHDSTDGIKEGIEEARRYEVELIPGVEVTSEKEGIEVHILGYFIDCNDKGLADLLKGLRESRVKRIYGMVEKLKGHNINISPDKVFKLSERGSIGRLHLAKALYNEGLVSSVKEAFNKYLGDNAPCYIRRFNVSPEETITVILGAGGVPVYAHPKVMGRDDFIPSFIKAGLRGLEAYHTDHNSTVSLHYLNLADKFGLLATGGSDCHGLGKERILMGGVTVDYSVVEDLKDEHRRILHEDGPRPC